MDRAHYAAPYSTQAEDQHRPHTSKHSAHGEAKSLLYYISLGKSPAPALISAPDSQKTTVARRSNSWLPLAPNTAAGQIQGTKVSSNILVLFVKDSGSGGRGKCIFWKGLVRSSAVLLH